MDTRINDQDKDYIKEIEQADQDIVIKNEEIEKNPRFLDSLVFNLVQKLELKQNLEMQYQNQLTQVKTYPEAAKYYIHIPYLLPILALTLGYMKYKKVLNINNGCFILCGASFLNEFARYKRTLGMDKKKAEAYTEHSNNYQFLIRKYTNSISGLNIIKYVLGVDFSKYTMKLTETQFDDDLNSEFLQDIYE